MHHNIIIHINKQKYFCRRTVTFPSTSCHSWSLYMTVWLIWLIYKNDVSSCRLIILFLRWVLNWLAFWCFCSPRRHSFSLLLLSKPTARHICSWLMCAISSNSPQLSKASTRNITSIRFSGASTATPNASARSHSKKRYIRHSLPHPHPISRRSHMRLQSMLTASPFLLEIIRGTSTLWNLCLKLSTKIAFLLWRFVMSHCCNTGVLWSTHPVTFWELVRLRGWLNLCLSPSWTSCIGIWSMTNPSRSDSVHTPNFQITVGTAASKFTLVRMWRLWLELLTLMVLRSFLKLILQPMSDLGV